MKKTRVMIVEDSAVVRELLVHIIAGDERLEVVAAVERGEEALALLHQVDPDVISLDIRLPGIDGFETTRKVMEEKPTPIVVVSASVASEDLNICMNALRAGALSVVEKPAGETHRDYQTLSEGLCTQLVIMSEVSVVRQRFNQRRLDFSGDPAACAPVPSSRVGGATREKRGPFEILGLVASTGGPNALVQILGSMPADFPLPVLVVQHIAEGFLGGFVSWLEKNTPFNVMLVGEPVSPRPGNVYMAMEDHRLGVRGGEVLSETGPQVSSQRPSGTVLFRSMAEHCGRHALGVLLTGMGEDGARGLKALKDAGGTTLAEDASTTVVYGMPGAAVRIDAVNESVPLHGIAAKILNLAGSRTAEG